MRCAFDHPRRRQRRQNVWEQEMEISSRHIGDVTILDLNGKLTIGTGDVALRGAMLTEINEGKKKVLINLQEVKAIDSSGLGELIRCRATAASNEAEVKLLHVNLKARKLLTMARLVGVFDMFDDEEMAIASFG
jgi:anti-sigma B factor antagonist